MAVEMSFTAVELGQILGITPRWIQKLVNSGILDRDEHGRYPAGNVGAFVKYRQDNRPTATLLEAQRREAVAKADLAEIKVRAMREQFVPVEEARAAVTEEYTDIRARLRASVDRLPPVSENVATGQAVWLAFVDEVLADLVAPVEVQVTP